jgi:hypothetical protein
VRQILPGIYHWTGFDEALQAPVHSHYIEPAGALLDPIVPEGGLAAFEGLAKPEQIILTNHRHYRSTKRYAEAFGCLIRVAHSAIDEMPDGDTVEPFFDGEEVAWEITAVEVDRVGEDETVLHIGHGGGAVAFGDTLARPGTAPVTFPADEFLGKHPDRARKGLKQAFEGLLVREFDALLFAHGEPVVRNGKHALRRFIEEPTEYPGFGPYGTEP